MPPIATEKTKAESTHAEGGRAIASPCRIIPVAPGRDLAVGPAGSFLLAASESRVLRAYLRLNGEPESPDGDTAEAIGALGRKGLLVHESQILSRIREHARRADAATIASAGVITRDRPKPLAACVSSLIDNSAAYGRPLEIVVVDASRDFAVRRANVAALRGLSPLAEIRYCGPRERAAFKNAMLAQGVDGSALEILERACVAPGSFGASRNALMLDLAGEAFLSADDDTVASPIVHPSHKGHIRLVGGQSPFDIWFFEDRRAAFQWAPRGALDIVGQHESLLGRGLSEILSDAGVRVDVKKICPHFAAAGWNARVIGTMAGRVGDSGRIDPSWDMLYAPWVVGRAAYGRLEVAELPESPAVVHEVGCMTMMFGLDLRNILPPFYPWHGGEDWLFSNLLGRLMPDACWGVVPHGIIHDRPPRSPESPVTFPHSADLVLAVLLSLPARRQGRSDAEAIFDTGVELAGMARLTENEIRQSVVARLGEILASRLAALRERIGSASSPEKRTALAGVHERLLDDFERLCGEDTGSAVVRLKWETLRDEILAYASLLQCWPAMFEAARELRRKGIRMSTNLTV